MNKLVKIVFAMTIAVASVTSAAGQTKSFIPVDGASLKAKIDNAVTQGRAGAQGGRFRVAIV